MEINYVSYLEAEEITVVDFMASPIFPDSMTETSFWEVLILLEKFPWVWHGPEYLKLDLFSRCWRINTSAKLDRVPSFSEGAARKLNSMGTRLALDTEIHISSSDMGILLVTRLSGEHQETKNCLRGSKNSSGI